jgi:hypothetical protein
MFRPISCIAVSIAGISLLSVPSWAFECRVCHSKNPGMVAMHKALQGKNCFECHKMGERLMGKGAPRDRAQLLARRASEPACLQCHGAPAASRR